MPESSLQDTRCALGQHAVRRNPPDIPAQRDYHVAHMLLSIEHETIYRYARPVQFGEHRLMVRALEAHDVQIRSSGLIIEPAYKIRWIHDVFGNSIAIVDFLEMADHLRVVSQLTVEQFNTNPFDFVIEPYARELPFNTTGGEADDLAVYQRQQFPLDIQAVRLWMQPYLHVQGRTRTLEFLLALNKSVPNYFQYRRREEPGVQTPGQTLRERSGSCRDFALLLMEAARSLGLAARFVSGYMCRSEEAPSPDVSQATHAWTEIYLPGAGWKGFDPTCGILAADSHVRVAVTRDPAQASPVSGSFVGTRSDYLGMEVKVEAKVGA